MSTGWSIFISVLVIGNLVGVMWLLFATSSKKSDESGEVESTGHEWDGISELNHPLPKWWFNMFILTTIFAAIYMYLYPALGNNEGSLGWTQLNQLDAQMEKNRADRAAFFSQFEGKTAEELQANTEAMKTASRLFDNNCSQCHGSDAKGSKGFPNLADDDWLYGNSSDLISQSILNGRQGVMPAFGAILDDTQRSDLTQYVLSLSNQSTDATKAEQGKASFDMQCAACHGIDGKGNQLLGAPNLTDNIWLYGGLLRDIDATIANGRNGNMPSHRHLFSEQEAKVLSAYILSL
ncbi:MULTISPECIES: cytochrome-c oxidase, cbb3-type subunit III [unclassified Oleiphilus]|uniref:cytochrome-c oxidase, cbb3-type subunit III n=5 Tax=Oleiphilus TaxID=141450 RepID=UPI0007C402E3|nr:MULTISPECIES: cytochrome-c oxidase, cbb3-type subunit III [unclassified Oleiphilus]KZY43763.1 cytochrome C oxidase Cbb3 [Oleiphilus sp. HI0050]KZY91450.1 cytochrome C oxidase Cbb3 [Oleiphilus sp. HI0072]KZZ21136.1 cytochrome C oxidase Cbb3 [Oleiphilus sp. HI0081]KZY36107.1 cytochrome C oxidase Cbb3 [Oleiphilus sp. HI0043]KZZ31784.1 cytochrome C oxidase Cbb3 [Oleiphilus sp. HI0086]